MLDNSFLLDIYGVDRYMLTIHRRNERVHRKGCSKGSQNERGLYDNIQLTKFFNKNLISQILVILHQTSAYNHPLILPHHLDSHDTTYGWEYNRPTLANRIAGFLKTTANWMDVQILNLTEQTSYSVAGMILYFVDLIVSSE